MSSQALFQLLLITHLKKKYRSNSGGLKLFVVDTSRKFRHFTLDGAIDDRFEVTVEPILQHGAKEFFDQLLQGSANAAQRYTFGAADGTGELSENICGCRSRCIGDNGTDISYGCGGHWFWNRHGHRLWLGFRNDFNDFERRIELKNVRLFDDNLGKLKNFRLRRRLWFGDWLGFGFGFGLRHRFWLGFRLWHGCSFGDSFFSAFFFTVF